MSAKDVPIVRLYDQVARLKLAKGEFETTAEFDERASAAFAEKVTLLEKVGGVPRVVVTAERPHWQYDADKGTLSLSSFVGKYSPTWLWSRTFLVGTPDLNTTNALFAPVSQSEGVAGSYTGSNAFGVTRQVTAVRGQEYGVALTDQASKVATSAKDDDWAIIPKGDGFVFRMTPEQARVAKDKIGVRIIGDLVPPGAVAGRDSHSATLSSPTDRVVALRYVTIRAVCAAIVVRGQGEVLRRLR